MGYSCAKFGDFSFSGFGLSCGQTDRQTDIRQNHAVELKTHTARALLKHVQHQLYMRCELKLCLHQGNMLPGNMLLVAGNKIVASLLPVCCWIQRDTSQP